MEQTKIQLDEKDLPRQWYNLAADLPNPPLPPLGPDGKPIGPEMLAPVFPMNLIEQEVSTQRWIDIPEEILEILSLWRPSPLYRARRLEKALGTPAHIYYKNEGVSPPGSHKPNTSIAQAWYNKQFGIERLTTETGAGQWGSALAFACSLIGLECKVFMVRISFDQKPYRKLMMNTWGAQCVASPSQETQAGRNILEKMPDTPGSLGIAISEAIEAAVTDTSGKTRYSLGSVLNHVLLHQTIIGLETKKQLKKAGEKGADRPAVVALAGRVFGNRDKVLVPEGGVYVDIVESAGGSRAVLLDALAKGEAEELKGGYRGVPRRIERAKDHSDRLRRMFWWRHVGWWSTPDAVVFYLPKVSGGSFAASYNYELGDSRWFEKRAKKE